MIRLVYLFACCLILSFGCKEAATTKASADIVEAPERTIIPERPQEIEVLDLSEDVALFVVIAGAYSSEKGAQKKATVLVEAGFPNAAVIQRPGSKLYSALVERFDSEEAAENFAEQIATNNEIKSYVYELDE